jgi:RNA polymerase sigma factor (sigma-70 family)
VSPLALRRYRAERLLRRDFHALRPGVLAGARRRLASLHVRLDEADLEACYAQAWQGLYTTVLAGEPVATPAGWLVTVTVRRAIDEHRRRARQPQPLGSLKVGGALLAAAAPDPVARLDDRARLREVFEALRGRLSRRECEAASLCYLQGLSRAEAAQRMGVSRRRMDKLMDGAGAAPGVAAKVGELLTHIRGGRWCEEQASLMRGLAFGLLDPQGERYRLAVVHQRECPACRAYVASLRGLAAVLPPPSLPVGALGAGAGGSVAGANGAAAAGSAGAAGGGWFMLGGSMTAKVAASCLIAFGLGAGCIGLGRIESAHAVRAAITRAHHPHQASAGRRDAVDVPATVTRATPAVAVESAPPTVATVARPSGGAGPAARPAERAAREFGLESEAAANAPSTPPAPAVTSARAARLPVAVPPPPVAAARDPGSAGSAQHAEREFGVQ